MAYGEYDLPVPGISNHRPVSIVWRICSKVSSDRDVVLDRPFVLVSVGERDAHGFRAAGGHLSDLANGPAHAFAGTSPASVSEMPVIFSRAACSCFRFFVRSVAALSSPSASAMVIRPVYAAIS